jgi:hypothetical protein
MAEGYIPTQPRPLRADVVLLVRELGVAVRGARDATMNLSRAERDVVGLSKPTQAVSTYRSVAAQWVRRERLATEALKDALQEES